MPWNLIIMGWSQRPLATSQFKCQLFTASAEYLLYSVRCSNFYLCLLLNMGIFALASYSKVCTLTNVKLKYTFEIALNGWMMILFPTETQLRMGVPLSFDLRILNWNISADPRHQNELWQEHAGVKQTVVSDLPTWFWPWSQTHFSVGAMLLWSWQSRSKTDKITDTISGQMGIDTEG